MTPIMTDTVDRLLAETVAELAGRRLPESTYRLQFQTGFTFRDAAELTPYLDTLGITDFYASPYLKARPGSQHGYDVTDHNQLNPELGTAEDYDAWTSAAQARGMGQVLDVVPNHMAATDQNRWWNDVLENGPASPYSGFFDISWSASPRPELQGRILVPVLGEPYGKALESQRLQLGYADGAFSIHYFDHRFPVSPDSYGMILEQQLPELQSALAADSPAHVEYESILTAIKHLPPCNERDPERIAERQREKEVIKRRLAKLTEESPQVRDSIEATCALFNGRQGDPHSFDLLERLLDRQAYRLAYWRVAADEINYRRFFDVNDLVALNMEREDVFLATHTLVLRLLQEGKVSGLRVDHPDGLFDPKEYLLRLQQRYLLDCARRIAETRQDPSMAEWTQIEPDVGERILEQLRRQPESQRCPLYVVVEKILGRDEALPRGWATYGTTGYEFLNLVNGLFVDASNAAAFTRIYREWINDDTPFAEIGYHRKILILQIALSSELQMLSYQLDRLAQQHRRSRDFTQNSLRYALREIIACFPVYRTYINGDEIQESDRLRVLQAVRRAMARNPALSTAIFQFISDMLLLRSPETGPISPEFQAEQRRFVGKFQQVTAPVMAKGLEDTAFYVYNRLLSLNEVGGNPDRFGVPPASLHRALGDRQARWPWALSATSTHDTKRSEDVRARLNVLSELPDQWHDCVARWSQLNQPHRGSVDDAPAPDANEEYMLYQTLVGAWPLEPYSVDEYTQFVERVQGCMRKALHEAKVHTSWINPNVEYDDAVGQFVARILDPQISGPFLEDLRGFQERISYYGMLNSLAQTLIKITAPGVADIYQGTELWDFSLVDPDNRRRVDYGRRQELLAELQSRARQTGSNLRDLARELTAAWCDGRIKLYLTWQALCARRSVPGFFSSAEYLPVEVKGLLHDHVFSFIRRQGSRNALVAVPRLLVGVVNPHQFPCGPEVWKDTRLELPESMPAQTWVNVFTGETLPGRGGRPTTDLPLAQVFEHFPVALLMADAV
jgi:(1->4)-alpha-D-glucan 1-alpha-D-glucosylmutase